MLLPLASHAGVVQVGGVAAGHGQSVEDDHTPQSLGTTGAARAPSSTEKARANAKGKSLLQRAEGQRFPMLKSPSMEKLSEFHKEIQDDTAVKAAGNFVANNKKLVLGLGLGGAAYSGHLGTALSGATTGVNYGLKAAGNSISLAGDALGAASANPLKAGAALAGAYLLARQNPEMVGKIVNFANGSATAAKNALGTVLPAVSDALNEGERKDLVKYAAQQKELAEQQSQLAEKMLKLLLKHQGTGKTSTAPNKQPPQGGIGQRSAPAVAPPNTKPGTPAPARPPVNTKLGRPVNQ